YASEAFTLVRWLDFTPENLCHSQEVMAAHPGKLDIKSVNWYLPHFEHAYYGGVLTILRFAAQWASNYGVHSTFVIIGDPSSPDSASYLRRISEAFPSLASADVVVVHSDADLPMIPACDAAVATLWSTAYYVLKFNQTKRKFYFLQDFEPMFYPAGSTSAQVEATYRFGFYGITNTVTLKKHYEADYDGKATFFNPAVDTALFYPAPNREWGITRKPYKVFFYGRPAHWRNGFELGSIALMKLKEELGQRVQIIAAGNDWDPTDYGLGGIIENLGLLPYQETARLYRTCDAGLAMMFTRHPSYLPFEFMASGCLVVSNVNSATAWLLKDNENCLLSLPSASCIADTLARALQDHDLRRRITANAAQLIKEEFSDWTKSISAVYDYMCDPED
ncbi:MAG TPA: glycosyltransferase family 4 protein, partial [Roseiflexaceae bacterium]|nr:glycosyltransferase family 4 protein [Roseiflexaceae bacterium]